MFVRLPQTGLHLCGAGDTRTVRALLRDGLHLPAVQDLCGEQQGHPDRAVQPPAVHALPHRLAGQRGIRLHWHWLYYTPDLTLLSPLHSVPGHPELDWNCMCRAGAGAAPSAEPRSRGRSRSWWTPSTRAGTSLWHRVRPGTKTAHTSLMAAQVRRKRAETVTVSGFYNY